MRLDSAAPVELEGTKGGEQMTPAVVVDVIKEGCLPGEALVEVGVQTAEKEKEPVDDTLDEDLQTYIDTLIIVVD